MPKSFTELFEHEFPYYLSIGMSYELYWYGDVWLTKAYREAHKLKMKQLNANLHLQGAYFYEALLDVAPVLHAFAPKGTKPREYSTMPYDIYGERKENTTKTQHTKEQEAVFAKAYMNQMMRQMGSVFGKSKDETKQNKKSNKTNRQELKDDVQTPRE